MIAAALPSAPDVQRGCRTVPGNTPPHDCKVGGRLKTALEMYAGGGPIAVCANLCLKRSLRGVEILASAAKRVDSCRTAPEFRTEFEI